MSIGPKTIFIIPYRSRETQMKYFIQYFETRVRNQPDMEDAEYFFIHQKDNRPFNRGAMKNIGFIVFSKKYSNWRDITFVFHDIDQYPKPDVMFPYKTTQGVVTHYYGFVNTLGGAVAIKGSDFYKTKGYCNFWSWGYEDNVLQNRVLAQKLTIDRSIFYKVTDMKHLINISTDGPLRMVSKHEVQRYVSNVLDNLYSIKNLSFIEKDHSIDVNGFDTVFQPSPLYVYNLKSNELNLYSYLFKKKNVIHCNRKWNL
jgi:hypothetical protein